MSEEAKTKREGKPDAHHLVERGDKVGIEEATVEDGQTDNTANEAEVLDMLGVDTRLYHQVSQVPKMANFLCTYVGVDLKGIVVVRRVLEQTIEAGKQIFRTCQKLETDADLRVEHLV